MKKKYLVGKWDKCTYTIRGQSLAPFVLFQCPFSDDVIIQ
jgi:hypothetical protein